MKTKLLLLLLLPCVAFAETDIEIKGIRVGMSKEAYKQIVTGQSNFTIAGINSMYGQPKGSALNFDKEGNLDSFMFFFDSTEFSAMRAAITDKYPEIKCDNKIVTNAYNAKYNDIVCSLSDKPGILELKKFVNLKTSVLALRSHKLDLNESRNKLLKKKERAKDL